MDLYSDKLIAVTLGEQGESAFVPEASTVKERHRFFEKFWMLDGRRINSHRMGLEPLIF